MWENCVCVCVCPHFFHNLLKVPSQCIYESGRAGERLWACSTLSPPLLPPSPSFPLFPPPSQQLFSCRSWEVEPSCFSPHPRVTSRNSPAYWHPQTHTLFFSASALSHTHLAVDCVLTSFWTTDWGASIPTLLLGCCDCVFTLLCENRLTIRRNAFMVRCLTGHFCFLTSCCPSFSTWHFLWLPVYLLARLLLSLSRAGNLQKSFFPPF